VRANLSGPRFDLRPDRVITREAGTIPIAATPTDMPVRGDSPTSAAAPSPASAAAPAIRLDGIGKHYGDVVAVDRLDLDVADGEFFSMLGPSGSGKTTTLRLIAGLVQLRIRRP